ncbi:hypothetical protein NC652_005536 [Populus alba x Populus x berolinensis]|uniref:Uncharacterized protein n=1 Tax=Populus alba x Populus x berolinensis TaxID=444605 RepID=A0AAD6WD69_9ROSI|nr:hypothetical protein NC652_005536 [Populus alba x Populus x berolinensis]KAJ7006204.1 hypothetical protein NC653_005532 [Populus alba x Populus x berolinensis]
MNKAASSVGFFSFWWQRKQSWLGNRASSLPTMMCIFLGDCRPCQAKAAACPRTYREAVVGHVRDRCSPKS